MSDFNYEGAERMMEGVDGLPENAKMWHDFARDVVAAFLADNKLFKHKAGENYDHDGHACFERARDDSDE